MAIQITINRVTNGYIVNVNDEVENILSVGKSVEEVRVVVNKALKAFFSSPNPDTEE